MAEVGVKRSMPIGVDNVVSAWSVMNDGNPYFAVLHSDKKKFFQFNRADLEQSEQFLRSMLTPLEEDGDNSLYYINIYDESRPNYGNSGFISQVPFRLNAYNTAGSIGGLGNLDGFAKMLADAQTKQLEMMQEIANLKAENAPLDAWDRIGGLLETPGVAGAVVPLLQPIIQAITGIVTRLANLPAPQQQQQQYNGSVAGIAGPEPDAHEKEQQLDNALDRLALHGDLAEMLTCLANFADKNPEKFKDYLTLLKLM